MNNKELFNKFCADNYVCIYSQPWWLDAIVGPENWDVWIYEKGGRIWAAMPYYLEDKNGVKRITKPPLTQTNGLVVSYPKDPQSLAKRASYEEEICDAAIEFIESMGLDIYEQQFQYKYQNFLPFFWHRYSCIPRYTYVIEDTSDMEKVDAGISSKYKNMIRKGEKNVHHFGTIDADTFYTEHEKIFARQNLPVPFTREQWIRIYEAAYAHNAGEVFAALGENDEVLSLSFLVWDDESLYLDAGGPVPEHSRLQTYDALVHKSIEKAHEKGLKFDFEGSVVKQINHSFREYGGRPVEYYRFRKVFNPEIIRKEAEEAINALQK